MYNIGIGGILRKLAVFDLDETLYKCNSHVEIVRVYHGVNFNNLFFKFVSRLFPSLHILWLNSYYNNIPESYIFDYKFTLNSKAVQILDVKLKEGFEVVIISNAPSILVKAAGARFNVNYFYTLPYMKHKPLVNIDYDYLFVCTDNFSDINILEMANEKVIFCKDKHKKRFDFLDNVIFYKKES